jgi:hypothetical protein
MRGEGIDGGADGPDMNVVYVFDAVDLADDAADLFDVNVFWNAIERKAKAIAQQAPKCYL